MPTEGNTGSGQASSPDAVEQPERADILVAGSLAIDLSCDYAPFGNESTRIVPISHTSNPAVMGQSLGGVGHNVALASKYLGSSVLFCSVVGDNLSGRAALSELREEGLSTAGVQVLSSSSGMSTAQYVAINDAKKDLVLAMAGMGIMELPEHELDFGVWESMIQRTKPRIVVVDANWHPGVIAKWIALAKKHGARVAFEPVSTTKSGRLFSRGGEKTAIGLSDVIPNHKLSYAAPNKMELAAMHTAAREAGLFDSPDWWRVIDGMGLPSSGSRDRLVQMTSAALVDEGIPQQSIQLLPFIPNIITKLGEKGVLLTQLQPADSPSLTSSDSAPYILSHVSPGQPFGGVYMRLFPPGALAQEDIVSVNGAGDTFLGSFISAVLQDGKSLEDIISLAQEASIRTLKSPGGVSSDIASLQIRRQ